MTEWADGENVVREGIYKTNKNKRQPLTEYFKKK